MKTLILATVSAAALLAAGTAGAQTTNSDAKFAAAKSTITAQRGDSTQTSYVAQTGDSNSAKVDQTLITETKDGSPAKQSAVVLQGFGGQTAVDNKADVRQTGNDDRAVVLQAQSPNGKSGVGVGNGSTVVQAGVKNNAFTYQYGFKNQSYVEQTGRNSIPADGTSSSVNTSADAGVGIEFANSHAGADATANHLNELGARVIQNEAATSTGEIRQSNGSTDARGTFSNDRATISQYQVTTANAYITQIGSENAASSYQNGQDLTTNTQQNGTSNTAVTQQVGSREGLQPTFNSQAYTTQSGSLNDALTQQSGGNQYARTTQSGSNGAAATLQSGLYQSSEITQSGSFDKALTTQSGTTNTSNVSQSGANDASLVDQFGKGDRNYATINQTSAKAWSAAYQSGSANGVNVYQH